MICSNNLKNWNPTPNSRTNQSKWSVMIQILRYGFRCEIVSWFESTNLHSISISIWSHPIEDQPDGCRWPNPWLIFSHWCIWFPATHPLELGTVWFPIVRPDKLQKLTYYDWRTHLGGSINPSGIKSCTHFWRDLLTPTEYLCIPQTVSWMELKIVWNAKSKKSFPWFSKGKRSLGRPSVYHSSQNSSTDCKWLVKK